MRKILTTIMLMIITLTLSGCGNSIVKKSIEQAKTAIESKEYDKALLSLELALDEDKENKEANELYSIVESYQKANKLMDEKILLNQKRVLNEIDSEYINYAIKEDIETMKVKIDEYNKEIEKVEEYIKKAQEMFDNEQYVECKKYLGVNILGSEIDDVIEANKYATEDQKKITLELYQKCEVAQAEQIRKKEEEKALEEARRAESESKNMITKDKAIELIKKHLENNGKYVPNGFLIDSENDTEYRIKAYDNMGTHTATSGWYIVNKNTGSVESMF